MSTSITKEEFFNKISPVLAPSELIMVQGAYCLSKFGHRHQARKERDENGNNVRYFEHVRRAAIILIDELKINDPDLIVSNLLHDCIEDTQDITAPVIEYFFNAKVARIVRTLSNIPKQGYYERIKNADFDTLVVKFCDRLDNVRSLDHEHIEKAFRMRKSIETIEKYIPIFEKTFGSNEKFRPLLNEMNVTCVDYISRDSKL